MNGVSLWRGDCRELMAQIPDASVSAIITDPPYGTEVERDGYGRRQNYGGVGRTIAGDSDLSSLHEMLALAPRVLKPNSWVAIFCSPKRHGETDALCKSLGFPVAGEVVWDKASPGLGGGIRYQHETILLCKFGSPAGRASLFSVQRSHVGRENKHKRHPHEKPVDVVRNLVCYTTRPGEMVLDPFMGSGTTPVACIKAGRQCVGIEVSEDFFRLAERRVSESQTPLFAGMDA